MFSFGYALRFICVCFFLFLQFERKKVKIGLIVELAVASAEKVMKQDASFYLAI